MSNQRTAAVYIWLAPYIECWLDRMLVFLETMRGSGDGKRILVLRGDRHPAGD